MADEGGGAATRRRGRPPAQRSEDTRDRVLRAARVCFGGAGYLQTSMADIAEAAGITPRAIYHYVDSKAELFGQAASAAFARFFEEIAVRVSCCQDARGRLKGFVDAFRALYKEDPSVVAFVSLAMLEASRNPELVAVLDHHKAGMDISIMLVSEALARGELVGDIDPMGVATALDVFASGLTLVASADRGGDYLAMLDVIDHLIDGSLFVDEPGARPRNEFGGPSAQQ